MPIRIVKFELAREDGGKKLLTREEVKLLAPRDSKAYVLFPDGFPEYGLRPKYQHQSHNYGGLASAMRPKEQRSAGHSSLDINAFGLPTCDHQGTFKHMLLASCCCGFFRCCSSKRFRAADYRPGVLTLGGYEGREMDHMHLALSFIEESLVTKSEDKEKILYIPYKNGRPAFGGGNARVLPEPVMGRLETQIRDWGGDGEVLPNIEAALAIAAADVRAHPADYVGATAAMSDRLHAGADEEDTVGLRGSA